MKKLLKSSDDQYLSLLSHRATPLPWCNISPAELSMGREIRSNLHQVKEKLTPQWPYLEKFRSCNREFKWKQKSNYDRRHRVQPLPDVSTNGRQTTGRVVAPADTPRSYVVETPIPNDHSNTDDQSNSIRSPVMTRSRTGTSVAPPLRYQPSS